MYENKLRQSILNLFLVLAIAFVTMACGTRTETIVLTKEQIQAFEGEYFLENNGYIEIVQNESEEVLLLGSYRINSINPDNQTLALHPIISLSQTKIVNDKLLLVKDLNYKDGNDVEGDTGGDIRGQKRTDIEIYKDANGLLVLEIKIYSDKINNNANYVIAHRVIKEER
jgi:hypothetical protein